MDRREYLFSFYISPYTSRLALGIRIGAKTTWNTAILLPTWRYNKSQYTMSWSWGVIHIIARKRITQNLPKPPKRVDFCMINRLTFDLFSFFKSCMSSCLPLNSMNSPRTFLSPLSSNLQKESATVKIRPELLHVALNCNIVHTNKNSLVAISLIKNNLKIAS